MIAGAYDLCLLSATTHTVFLLRLFFCKASIINHYFCDLPPLLELSSSNTFINEVLALSFCLFNIALPALTILTSYFFIIVNVLHTQSSGGSSKAFNTCSSHSLACCPLWIYIFHVPSTIIDQLPGQSKLTSVFYTIIVPMLNLMMYSMRNKDGKIALKMLICKISFHSTKNNFN